MLKTMGTALSSERPFRVNTPQVGGVASAVLALSFDKVGHHNDLLRFGFPDGVANIRNHEFIVCSIGNLMQW